MITRIGPLLLGVVAVLGAATVLVAVEPALAFAYRSEGAHAALESVATVIALLAAFILYGRFRQAGMLSELVLFFGLMLLTAANLVRGVAPSFNGENELAVWLPLIVQILAAICLSLAPFIPARKLRHPDRVLAYAAAAAAAAAVLVVALVPVLSSLDPDLDPSISPADAGHPRVIGAAGLLALQLISMALYAIAAAGFAGRAARVSDELLAWFALAMALAALARLNYLLFPSVYSEWVFTGDMLRFGVYLAILVGALRQVASYQEAAARAAILEERKRIALDLHDSLAQDLAYISLQGQRLADSHEGAAGIAAAAKGALAQSRGTIATLRVGDLPLGEAIERVATALAERHGAELDLELDAGVDVRSVERDELLNVVSEAISNAARHGEASKLRITLSRGAGGLTLTITDDGRGFDVEAKRPDGAVGLNGMRERVERIGGDLGLESAPGQGTTIEVRLR